MHTVRALLLSMLAYLLRLARAKHGVPERILVIKPDHIGDVLLLTPALRYLRQTFPAAHIALMIGPWSAAAMRGNPDVDAVLTCEFPGFTRRPKPNLLHPYGVLLRTAVLLRSGRYDTAIIARDDHWWGALLALLARIPHRAGFAAPDVASLLSDALPHDPSEHVTVQALTLVEHLAIRSGVEHRSLAEAKHLRQVAPITGDDRAWAVLWLEAHGLGEEHMIVALHPGAGGSAKLWLPARWTIITTALLARGYQVILTGGPDEAPLVRQICSGLTGAVHTIIGEATLGQLAAIFERCSLVLGVDSGPLHLAAAAGAPTIVLFGPGDDRRFGPWGPAGRHRIVRSNLWCSPCGVLGACPRGTQPSECMTGLQASRVLPLLQAPPQPSASGVWPGRSNAAATAD